MTSLDPRLLRLGNPDLDDDGDEGDAGRGLVNACVFGAGFWALVAVVWWCW